MFLGEKRRLRQQISILSANGGGGVRTPQIRKHFAAQGEGGGGEIERVGEHGVPCGGEDEKAVYTHPSLE